MSLAKAKAHRKSRCVALREVLRDGHWWTSKQLVELVGHRFGSAIHLIRHGADGEPAWFIEAMCLTDDGRLNCYRFAGVNPNPEPLGGSWRARALAAEKRVSELEAQVRRLSPPSGFQMALFMAEAAR
jgi:hypothetical protein